MKWHGGSLEPTPAEFLIPIKFWTGAEEGSEISIERSRKIFTKVSPQLLWITLFISVSAHQFPATFSAEIRLCLEIRHWFNPGHDHKIWWS
jgi:hypothetical protein